MRKSFSKIIKISLILFVTGCAVLGCGMAMGGKAGFRVDIKNHKITTGERKLREGHQDTEKFTRISVKANTEDIIIIRTDNEFGVDYLVEETEPKISVKDGRLTVKQQSSSIPIGIDFAFFRHSSGKNPYIHILVPEEADLSEIMLETDTGDIVLNDWKTKQVRLSSDTGDITIVNLISETLEVDSDTGDIHMEQIEAESLVAYSDTGDVKLIDGKAQNMNMETDTGDIRLSGIDPVVLKAETDTGDVACEIHGKQNEYSMTLKSDTGDIKVDSAKQGKRYETFGSGNRKIEIKTDTGDIRVDFES